MCYADVTYLLAFAPQKDVSFEDHAETIRERLEEKSFKTYASEATLLELLFVSHNNDLDPVRLIRNIAPLVDFVNIKEKTALKAAVYMRDYGADPADSLHIAHSVERKNRLITSDMPIQDVLEEISGSPDYINLRSPNPRV